MRPLNASSKSCLSPSLPCLLEVFLKTLIFFLYVLLKVVVESGTVFCCAAVAVEALVGLLVQSGQVHIPTVLLFSCVNI